MTIAMCYMSPEGAVLGADSTSSALVSSGPSTTGFHYLNHNQKLFELGDNGTVGILTWGLAGLPSTSHRTILAMLADNLKETPPSAVVDVASRLSHCYWSAFNAAPEIRPHLSTIAMLEAKPTHDPNNVASRTRDEEQQLSTLKSNLVTGFCVAGYCPPDRTPRAYELMFIPGTSSPPVPRAIPTGSYAFWGVPNMIKRLMCGVDDNLREAILRSGKWTGTDAELMAILGQFQLAHPLLPIRDAIDFVHSCIYSTIKAMKFSNLFQVCGGPIEIAVITTDRNFRWVRHKPWDAAIMEGVTS